MRVSLNSKALDINTHTHSNDINVIGTQLEPTRCRVEERTRQQRRCTRDDRQIEIVALTMATGIAVLLLLLLFLLCAFVLVDVTRQYELNLDNNTHAHTHNTSARACRCLSEYKNNKEIILVTERIFALLTNTVEP